MEKEDLKEIRGKLVLFIIGIVGIITTIIAAVFALFGIHNNTILNFSLLIGAIIYAISVIITCLKD